MPSVGLSSSYGAGTPISGFDLSDRTSTFQAGVSLSVPLFTGGLNASRVAQALEQANAAARICAVNLLTQLKAACGGDLDRVMRCVKVGGFVACEPSFTDHPKVVNGASDFFAQVFGDKAKHARFAVGAPSLPLGASVEVEAIFEIK